MVTTAHNGRLSARDIWPNNIWNDLDYAKKVYEIHEEWKADPEAQETPFTFYKAQKMEEHHRKFGAPRLADRQRIMKKVSPPRAAGKPAEIFTIDEIEYLLMKLDRVNYPVGQDIVHKLEIMKAGH